MNLKYISNRRSGIIFEINCILFVMKEIVFNFLVIRF